MFCSFCCFVVVSDIFVVAVLVEIRGFNMSGFFRQYFQYCEEIEWAVEVLKETGKPVAASMCINTTADSKGVPTEECGVRLVKAGRLTY